jgi:hypothetical protein
MNEKDVKYKVLVFNGSELVTIRNNLMELADAVKYCEESPREKFEIHQVGSNFEWDYYMFGEKKPNGHISWKRVEWKRM